MHRLSLIATVYLLTLPSGLLALDCPLEKNGSGEFLIKSYPDLKKIGSSCPTDPAATYRLANDIDASASASETNGNGTGIGPLPHLYGKFHGGGHAISDPITQGTLSAGLNYTIDFTGSALTILPPQADILARLRFKVPAVWYRKGTLNVQGIKGWIHVYDAGARKIATLEAKDEGRFRMELSAGNYWAHTPKGVFAVQAH